MIMQIKRHYRCCEVVRVIGCIYTKNPYNSFDMQIMAIDQGNLKIAHQTLLLPGD